MGMFTTITQGNRNYQIKFGDGYDICGVYEVGDRLDCIIDPRRPYCGFGLDDVYLGIGNSEDVWVVIKDSVILAVEPCNPSREFEEYFTLRVKYVLQDPPEALWSPHVITFWRDKVDRLKLGNPEFVEAAKDLSPSQELALAMRQYI